MANNSLALHSLSCNEIKILTQIFETKIKYFFEHTSPFERDYFRTIRTFVGLGYTAALEDGEAISLYKSRLDEFLQFSSCRTNTLSVSYLSSLIVEMIDLSLWFFRFIGKHEYCKEFSILVNKTISGVPLPNSVSSEDVNRLAGLIKEKSF